MANPDHDSYNPSSRFIQDVFRFFSQPNWHRMLSDVIQYFFENTLAQRCLLFLRIEDELRLSAYVSSDDISHIRFPDTPLVDVMNICTALVHVVDGTKRSIFLNGKTRQTTLQNDSYLRTHPNLSALCLNLGTPESVGIVYLEHENSLNAFSEDDLKTMDPYLPFISLSLWNRVQQRCSELACERIQDKLAEKDVELKDKNIQLERALKQMQRQPHSLDADNSTSETVRRYASKIYGIVQKPLKSFADNVGDLSVELANEVKALKKQRDSLEDEVQKRTKELEEKNVKLETTLNQLSVKNVELEKTLEELHNKNVELESTLKRVKVMQRQIVMQEKMASLGQLTAGIAHEIKNPLNFINNFSDVASEIVDDIKVLIKQVNESDSNLDDSELIELFSSLEQNLEKINQHGKRADSIIRSMMLHASGKPSQPEEVNVNNLLEEAINLSYHSMRAKDSSFNTRIEKEFAPSLPLIEGVPQNLQRVFINILTNACQSLMLKTAASDETYEPTLRVTTKAIGTKVAVRIWDNGIGISREIMDHIFQPFFTTKPTGEGIGLGLSMSYDIIVDEHRGKISVDSEEGKYCEFTIVL
jgi:signal transduction histidine kinase